MTQHVNFIEDIQNQVTQHEGVYHNVKSLNKDGNNKDNRILYICSMNHNFGKFEILIKSLKLKLYVIVCAE